MFVATFTSELSTWQQLEQMAKRGQSISEGKGLIQYVSFSPFRITREIRAEWGHVVRIVRGNRYMFDLIYITWFVHVTTALVSTKFWYAFWIVSSLFPPSKPLCHVVLSSYLKLTLGFVSNRSLDTVSTKPSISSSPILSLPPPPLLPLPPLPVVQQLRNPLQVPSVLLQQPKHKKESLPRSCRNVKRN